MENKLFTVDIDAYTGGIKSIISKNDKDKANCVKIGSDFNCAVFDGIFAEEKFDVAETKFTGGVYYARRESERLAYESEISFAENGNLKVNNVFINTSEYPVFFNLGELGINLSFADEYPDSETCMRERFHQHNRCGNSGESYICALKMGESADNIGLYVTEGGFVAYGQRGTHTNDRGKFIFYPNLKSLSPNEKYALSYEIFPCVNKDDFIEKCKGFSGNIHISADNFSLFANEKIIFYVECAFAPHIFFEKNEISFDKVGKNKYKVEYVPDRTGEHIFTVRGGGKETQAAFNVMLPMDELARRRIAFIAEKQQYCGGGILDGAYLVYDCETNGIYYDRKWADCNAGRERVGMGLLIARYLRTRSDERLKNSLMRYEEFVRREIYDDKTGEIYDDAGCGGRCRLYNFLWFAEFYVEMFYLTENENYIRDVVRIIKRYYEKGGEKHYPNAVIFSDFITLLQDFGTEEELCEIKNLFKKHITYITEFGADYPIHEVNYEQTIVSPAVTLLIDAVSIFGKEKYAEILAPHLKRWERFDGFAPHYKQNNVAIRYWDGFWFGKKHVFGDTLPHYWSCLSAADYLLYGKIAEDKSYIEKGRSGLRNCLCLFFEDGSASCASVFPYKVNGQKGDYYDPYANDQDFALYYALRFLRDD